MNNYNFKEVINEFSRMCKSLNNRCNSNKCPVAQLIEKWEDKNNEIWDERCISFAREEPEKFEKAVMEWAKEHPHIYPTIREVISKIITLQGYNINDEWSSFLDSRISKETADYFGILPINKEN